MNSFYANQQRAEAEQDRRAHRLYLEAVLRAQGGNLRTPRPAYASDPSIIEGEFKVVSDGR